MRAVISVIGKDKVGILAKVSAKCEERNVNIIDVSQTVLDDLFAMVMLVDISNINIKFGEFAEEMKEYGKEFEMDVRVMHEDIFNSMHRI